MFDQAELGDRFAKLNPLFGIGDSFLHGSLASSHSACTQSETPHVEDIESDDVTFSNLSEEVFHRDFDIREDHASCLGAFHSHLVLFLIHRDSVIFALDNECGEFGSVHFGIGREHIGNSGIGDELLLAV